MLGNPTKDQRRHLRELGGIAHERELSAALTKLEGEFTRWRAGGIDAFELSEAIHQFHQGPARELFTKYDPPNLDFAVAAAIHRGLLSREEAGAEVMPMLERHLAFLASQGR